MEKTVKDSTLEDGSASDEHHDEATLARLGIDEVAKRDIGLLTIMCTGWNISNAWAAVAGTLAIAIASGGTVVIIYGIIVILVLGGCSVASLAELASVYPTAGGQYHWTSILAPKRWNRGISYVCGALNIFSWISICASVAIIVPQLVLAMAIFYDPQYEPKTWHYFLLYQASNFIFSAYNIFLLKRTSWIQDVGFALTTSSFVVMVVTCLARATDKQPSEFVWTRLVNSSGWVSDGVVFLTGLVTPNYIYGGIDGAIHLAEECSNAHTAVPRALIATILVGFLTGFTFAVAMTYSMSDFQAVLNSNTGAPIYEIWNQATRSSAAATIFMVLLLFAVVLSLNACQQTASRLTWSFARDNALILSKFIGRMHPTLNVPVWAIIVNSWVVFIIGCVYLGSSTAFNAIVGTGLILQQMTFSIPIALLLYRRRGPQWLPESRSFKLPGVVGWIANIVTCAFGILVLIFYNFPVIMPVTPSNMNYTSAVLGCMVIFTILNWVFYARFNYRGPRIQE